MPKLKPNCSFSLLLVSGAMISLCPKIGATIREQWIIDWGTHLGSSSPIDAGDTNPTSIQYLYDIGGTKLATSGTGDSYTGDLIELGFSIRTAP